MADPVGVTLGALGLLAPAYDACNRLYHKYKLTQSFGDDFFTVQMNLEMQYCRLDVTSRRRLLDLETPIEANNPEAVATRIVLRALSLIKSQFTLANELMKKYDTIDDTVRSSNSVQSSISTDLPSLQTSSNENRPTVSSSTSVGLPAEPKRGTAKVRRLFARHHKMPESRLAPITSVDAAQVILDSPVVENMEQEQAQKSQYLQSHASFFRRVIWATEDRKLLYEIIEKLNNANNFLESILVCKPLQDPTILSEELRTSRTNGGWVKGIPPYLWNLHNGLRYMNTGGNGHGPWKWTIQLSTDYESDSANIFHELYELPLQRIRTKHFKLKRHLQQRDKEASFFVAEASWGVEKDDTHDPKELAQHLDQAEVLKSGEPIRGFKNWGTVRTDRDHDGVHRLFHAEEQISHVAGTLPDMLNDENAQKMTPRQRVELATLIALSFIHFRFLRRSCQDIKPSNFLFYSTSQDSDPWDEDNLLILRPYLDFGFGQRPPQRMLGECSGVSRGQDAQIVELGLLLYQIGCCTSEKYGFSSKALADARRKVGLSLALLDTKVSMAFTEVTQDCLQYTAEAATALGVPVDIFLENVVSRLTSMQGKLY